MNDPVMHLTLTRMEATYVVGAIKTALPHLAHTTDRDREILKAVMFKLAAPLNLDDDVRAHLENDDKEKPT